MLNNRRHKLYKTKLLVRTSLCRDHVEKIPYRMVEKTLSSFYDSPQLTIALIPPNLLVINASPSSTADDVTKERKKVPTCDIIGIDSAAFMTRFFHPHIQKECKASDIPLFGVLFKEAEWRALFLPFLRVTEGMQSSVGFERTKEGFFTFMCKKIQIPIDRYCNVSHIFRNIQQTMEDCVGEDYMKSELMQKAVYVVHRTNQYAYVTIKAPMPSNITEHELEEARTQFKL